MSQAEVENVKKNRERLIVIIRCVLYLVRQGLPWRRHTDNSQHNIQPDINSGNFQELLKLMSEIGNRCKSVKECTKKCNIQFKDYIESN